MNPTQLGKIIGVGIGLILGLTLLGALAVACGKLLVWLVMSW